jgi:hypothetical protein
VKSTFSYAFWQGNNPDSWGTDKIPKPSAERIRLAHDGSLASINRQLWEARHETLYIDDVVLKPRGYARFRGLSEPARSRLLGDEAWAFVREQPESYARLCWQRLRYFLLFDETNPKASHPVYRASTVAWLVLAFVGALASRSHWRRLWPTWSAFAAVTAFHVLTIVSARFRAPIEPLSFVWPAIALAPVFSRLGTAWGEALSRLASRRADSRVEARDEPGPIVLPGPGMAPKPRALPPAARPGRRAA